MKQAIIDARRPGASEKVGGIPLFARTVYHLGKLGLEEVIILLNEEAISPQLARWHKGLRLRWIRVADSSEDISQFLSNLPGLDERFLFIEGFHLVDPRILKALIQIPGTTLAFVDAADAAEENIRAGTLNLHDLRVWKEAGRGSLVRNSFRLFPDDLDPFCPEVRGPRRPYLVEVESSQQALEATRLLIRSQQKHIMDLPAEFIDPPFENALTFWLCQTPITPNMITLLGGCVAVLVAWLFWHGYFLAGAILTFPVEILDGVDGKLARTKLHYTRLGKREDVIDYFYENSWYVALGVGLTGIFGGYWPSILACLLILSDTIDNVLYTFAGIWHGKSIDLFSPFDGAFRRIAGRRNIYGVMFIVGFALGCPLGTFAIVSVWAAVTATIHWIRLVQFGRETEKGSAGLIPRIRPWPQP